MNGNVLTLTFTEPMDEDSVPATDGIAFRVRTLVGGEGWSTVPVADVSISGHTVTLTLTETIPSRADVLLIYKRPAWDPLFTVSRFPVGPFTRVVTVLTPDTTAPFFSSASLRPYYPPVWSGGCWRCLPTWDEKAFLWIDFSEVLDKDVVPAASAFRVTVRPPGGGARSVAVTRVVNHGSEIAMEVGPVRGGQDAKVTVSYVKPSADGLRDRAGNLMESFSGKPVTNGPPRVESMALVSDPGGDRTYGRGERVRVGVTFDGPVSVVTRGGVPRLRIVLGESGGGRWASYEGGHETDTLTFAYTVAGADSSGDTGVRVVGHSLQLNGGEIGSVYQWPREYANLDHAWLPHDPAHKVDAALPLFQGATVDEKALTMTFTENLDTDSTPAPVAFRVTVNNARRNVETGGVAISGKTVTLTLASEVSPTDTVKVRYTRPRSNPLQGAGGVAVDTFTDQAVTNNTLVTIWSATLTTKDLEANIGCEHNTSNPCTTALTSSSFMYGGVTYQVSMVNFRPLLDGPDLFAIQLDQPWPETPRTTGLLIIGSNRLSLSGASTYDSGKSLVWSNPGFVWTGNQQVSLRLAIPPVVPLFQSAAVDGKMLTMTFTENLDTDSTPAPVAFRVTVNGARRNVETGGVAISGKTVTLTLASEVSPTDTVKVRYTRPRSNPLQGAGGIVVDTFPDQAVTNNTGTSGNAGGDSGGEPASVTGVTVISRAGTDKTYGLGDTIHVRVTFDEPVDVTGTPRLKIDMDPAEWGEKWAAYESGSGTSSLTFAHTVVEPNISRQGIAVLANTLELNGGTIRSGGNDADLSHNGQPHDANHKVDWQTEPESGGGGGPTGTSDPPGGASGDSGGEQSAPASVSGVTITSDPGNDDTYARDDVISITVTFSEAVTVTGSPRLKIDMDPAEWGEKWAAYQGGSGTATLTFTHTVAEPNISTQGIAVLADTLELNGGTIQASGVDADLAHTALGHDDDHKVDWRPAAATVTSLEITSDAGGDDTYAKDDVIRITLTFSEAVTVTGSPRLKIDMDPAEWGEKWAVYESGSGTATLTFVHTVVEPNYSTQGIAVLMNSLELSGGTIRVSGVDADLSHTGLAHDADHKVDWRLSQEGSPGGT